VRKTDRARHPIPSAPISAQQVIPIEILRQGLQHDGYIAQPQGAMSAVAKQVDAHVTKVILRSQDPHVRIAEANHL
jgi:hypothetical protein